MSITDFDQQRFLKQVRGFMKDNKITVRQFTKLSGVAYAHLYHLEQGKSEMTFTTIRKLQKAMDEFRPDII